MENKNLKEKAVNLIKEKPFAVPIAIGGIALALLSYNFFSNNKSEKMDFCEISTTQDVLNNKFALKLVEDVFDSVKDSKYADKISGSDTVEDILDNQGWDSEEEFGWEILKQATSKCDASAINDLEDIANSIVGVKAGQIK